MARAARGRRRFDGGSRTVSATLRPANRADGPWLDDWLPPVAASAGYRWDGRTDSADRDTRIIERDGERVGAVILRAPAAARAIIDLLAAPPQHARRGAGMQAAILLEHELRARGVREIIAPAPEAHGIAMYFWIRLGYAPLAREQWPCTQAGVAWMVRRLET